VNQCIGVRNHRAFVLCLLVAFLNFLFLGFLAFYEIVIVDMIKRSIRGDTITEYCKKTLPPANPDLEIALDATICLLIAMKYLMRIFCQQRISFGFLVMWLGLEIVIV